MESKSESVNEWNREGKSLTQKEPWEDCSGNAREENLVPGTLEGFWVEKREDMMEGRRENTRRSFDGQYVDRLHQPSSCSCAGVRGTGNLPCSRCYFSLNFNEPSGNSQDFSVRSWQSSAIFKLALSLQEKMPLNCQLPLCHLLRSLPFHVCAHMAELLASPTHEGTLWGIWAQ
jgi:hypothetical protein